MGANILGFNGIVHSVVGDVPVNSEAPVVTSSISRICRLSLRRCSACVVSVCVILCNLKNSSLLDAWFGFKFTCLGINSPSRGNEKMDGCVFHLEIWKTHANKL